MDDRESKRVATGKDLVMELPTSKVCSKCGEHQSLDEFYKTEKGKYGRSSQCKSCKREYYLANQDRYKARTKAYREKFLNSGLECSVPGCNNPIVCKWYCDKHRSQLRNHGKILPRTKYDPNDIIIKGDIAEVILRDRKQTVAGRALIDAEDVERVSQLHWHLKSYCVQAYDKDSGKLITLSRYLMDPPRNARIAYLNHDFMDNRKSNLRVCTTQQIGIHRRIGNNNTSGVKGVSWNKKRQKWYVCLVKDGQHFWGGAYHKLSDAVEARKKLEREHFSKLVLN
jgi:hypothetical protein